MLAVSEVFYSIQGEGKTIGIPSVFVRLAGCNLMCGGMGTMFDKELHNGATWRCDTIEVWTKGKSKDYDQILDQECIQALKNGAHLIITGGEPMMQQNKLIGFYEYVRKNINENVFIEMETNGTIKPSDKTLIYVDLFNCSPKLKNSGNDLAQAYKLDVIKYLNAFNTIFKFVVSSDQDWKEIKYYYLDHVDQSKIYLMPSGENQNLLEESKLTVVELAKKNHLNFTTRLHIDLWNQKTGV